MDKQKTALIGLILGISSLVLSIIGMAVIATGGFGMFCSFVTPIVSIAGAIMGGICLKNPDGSTNGLGLGALITGVIATIIALPVFIVCGVCSCGLLCSVDAIANGINSSIDAEAFAEGLNALKM